MEFNNVSVGGSAVRRIVVKNGSKHNMEVQSKHFFFPKSCTYFKPGLFLFNTDIQLYIVRRGVLSYVMLISGSFKNDIFFKLKKSAELAKNTQLAC